MKVVIFSLFVAASLAGCASARNEAAEAAHAEAKVAADACRQMSSHSMKQRAECLNAAMSKVVPYSANPSGIRLYMAKRLQLAEQVEAGYITRADAEVELARVEGEIIAAERREARDTLLVLAATTPRSTTCTRLGNTVTCY